MQFPNGTHKEPQNPPKNLHKNKNLECPRPVRPTTAAEVQRAMAHEMVVQYLAPPPVTVAPLSRPSSLSRALTDPTSQTVNTTVTVRQRTPVSPPPTYEEVVKESQVRSKDIPYLDLEGGEPYNYNRSHPGRQVASSQNRPRMGKDGLLSEDEDIDCVDVDQMLSSTKKLLG